MKLSAEDQWCRAQFLDGYRRHGRRDEAWNRTVERLIELQLDWMSQSRLPTGDEPELIIQLAEQAIAAGCDDPLVLYLHAQHRDSIYRDSLEEIAERRRIIADATLASDHSPFIKTIAVLESIAPIKKASDGLTDEQAARLDHLRKSGLEQFAIAVADAQAPPLALMNLGDLATEALRRSGMTSSDAHDLLAGILEKHSARRTNFLVIRAHLFQTEAWLDHAVKLNYGPNSEALAAARSLISRAEMDLIDAQKEDPRNPVALITAYAIAELLGDEPDKLHEVFQRAEEPDPVNLRVHRLRAQIRGLSGHLESGRFYFETSGWERNLPLLLVDGHLMAANIFYQHDRRNTRQIYLSDPDNWNELSHLFEQFLKNNPDSVYQRCRYIKAAVDGGHWQEAHRQITVLGDRFSRRVFSRSQFDRIKEDIAENVRSN